MKEKMKEICLKALEVFPVLKEFYEKVNKEERLPYPKDIEDVNKYNFIKLYRETYNAEILKKFLNVVMQANCELYKRGYVWRLVVHQCLRTLEEQADLWLKGRYESGNVVTWVIPGESLHNYGCAVDLVFWLDNFSWDERHPWEVISKSATKYGCNIVEGDKPHFEYRLEEILKLRKEVARFIAKEMKNVGLDPFLKRKTIPEYLKGI